MTDGASTGSALRIGIIHARWNTKIIDALLEGARKKLREAGVKDENVVVQSVPGSYELPYAVKQYAMAVLFRLLPANGNVTDCIRHPRFNPPTRASWAQQPISLAPQPT